MMMASILMVIGHWLQVQADEHRNPQGHERAVDY